MRCRAALLTLMILAACEPVPEGDIGPIVAMAQQVMGTDCERAAAEAFDLPWRDLHVSEIEGQGREFRALGQYPEEGEAQLRFVCRYGPEGQFQSVSRL